MEKSLPDRQHLDTVKGVAIFLMLWGHCIQYCTNSEIDFFNNSVFRIIYTFHMPLFMLVSGYLFYFSCKKRDFMPLLLHRTQAMLQPIIMCNILIWATTYFVSDLASQRNIFTVFGGGWIRSFSGLWFLWSVLASSIVLCVATKAAKNIVLKVLIVIFGFFFVCLFPNWQQNLIMYPYFLLGFVFSKYKSVLQRQIMHLKYVSLLAFPALLVVYFRYDYTFANGFLLQDNLKNTLLINAWEWTLGIFGSIFALVIIELLYIWVFSKKPLLVKPVSQLGVKSLQIYCVSVSVLSYWLPVIFGKLCEIIGRNIFVSHMWFYNFVFTPLLAVAYAIFIYYIVKAMEKLKISNLVFGR